MINLGWYSLFSSIIETLAYLLYIKGHRIAWQHAMVVIGVVFAIWLTAFVLQGIGLYKLAKKKGAKHRRLAFVPFAYTLLVEELAGEIAFFGRKVRKLGLWAMIAEIVSAIYHVLMSYALFVLYVKNSALYEYVQVGGVTFPQWTVELGGAALAWLKFYNLSDIGSIISLVESILFVMLYIGFYKRYAYNHANILSVASIFVPFFNPIATFCLRGRDPIDYEAILRARREAFQRQQQQWQNGPYGGGFYGPYGGPYSGPYGNPNRESQPKEEEKPQDPFGEFAEDKTKNDSNGKGGNDFF